MRLIILRKLKKAKKKETSFSLESPDILALKGLGQFERFKAASSFRKMIESWQCV